MLQKQSRERPADRACKPTPLRQDGDGGTRRMAVVATERCEGGILEAGPQAEAKHDPSRDEHPQRRYGRKHDEASGDRRGSYLRTL